MIPVIIARAIVLLALYLAHSLEPPRHTENLLGWDAQWYRDIAEHGYSALPHEAIRFFPLLPILGRILSLVLPGDSGVALLVLANAAAVAYGALARHIAVRDGLGPDAARCVPWAVALCPAGFVLVMGYTEALYGVLVCCVLLATRSRRWPAAMACGLLAGLLRPTGILLTVPIMIEALSSRSDRRLQPDAAHADQPSGFWRAAAPLGPAAGLLMFVAWCGIARGDALAPFRAQTAPTLRGGILVNPFRTVLDAAEMAADGHLEAAAPLIHLLWAILAGVLLVVCARRLPLSYTAFAACTLVLAVTSRGLSSFERYAGSAVPLLLAGSTLLTTRSRRLVAVIVGCLAMACYCFEAMRHGYVP